MHTVVSSPGYNRHWVYPTPIGGLGDLYQRASGDTISYCLTEYIIKRIQPGFSRGSLTLANLFSLAATMINQGETNSLAPADQGRWAAWKKQMLDNGPSKVFWTLVHLVRTRGKALSDAAFRSGTSWITDPKEGANVLLVATGTGMTGDQWHSVSWEIVDWVAQEIIKGTLNFNYLGAAFQGLFQPDVASRKFPVWLTPTAFGADAVADGAWANFLKQSGWSNVVTRWKNYTSATWAAQSAALESKIAVLQGAATVLSYASGEVVVKKLSAMLDEYKAKRATATANLKNFNTLLKNPATKAVLPGALITEMQGAEKQFLDIDSYAYNKLNPLGLWDMGATGPQSLQGVQLIVAASLAVVAAGILAYAVKLLTVADRAAAAGYEQAMKHIDETITTMKASCERSFKSKEITEEQYRKCLDDATKVLAYAPPPPKSGSGMGAIAIAGVAAAGVLALVMLKK
jgi:hypothetical protein